MTVGDAAGLVPFDRAWQRALYGPDGFYHRSAPEQHFRTSVAAGGLLAQALARLAREAGLRRVVDVGAGRGRLLADLHGADPGLELVGLDVVPRPDRLPDGAQWLLSPGGTVLPGRLGEHLPGALVVAHEWLDDVPCAVAERDAAGHWCEVRVDPASGEQVATAPLGGTALAWLDAWWPGRDERGASHHGERAEVGVTRDAAWAGLVRTAVPAAQSSGEPVLLLAVDYQHDRHDRPRDGTLLGYRDGSAVPPVPDGSCDITAHVALDSVAAAGADAGAGPGLRLTQRAALQALGVSGRRPPVEDAARDPRGYLAALERAGHAAELLDPAGLGGFGWLLQPVGPSGQVAGVLARLAG